MSAPRVLKFGGVGLRDGAAVRRAVEIIRSRGGSRPVVVVSAHAGVTDLLGEAADHPHRWAAVWDRVRIRHRTLLRELSLPGDLVDRHLRELRTLLERFASQTRLDGRARDYVLSFGERMSARVVAAALRKAGSTAAPLDAFDLGLVGERRAGRFLPEEGAAQRVRRSLLAMPGIPVVTGFLASDRAGNLTTLGRNGSDLSAAWIATAIEAEELQLWKTVGGVMTADPSLVPEARVVDRLGFAEALALGAAGAAVIHPGAIDPARSADLAVRLFDARDPEAKGTVLTTESGESGPRALAHRAPLARIKSALDWGRDPGQQLVDLLARLHTLGVEPRAGAVHGNEIHVLLDERDGRHLEPDSEISREVEIEQGLGSLSAIGPAIDVEGPWRDELREHARTLGIGLEPAPVVGDAGGTGSSSSLTVLVRTHELPVLARALHALWFESPVPSARRSSHP